MKYFNYLRSFKAGPLTRPTLMIYGLFLSVGFVIYVASHFLSAPAWLNNFFEIISPTLTAMARAKFVAQHFNQNIFTAQINVLYSFLFSILSFPCFLYAFFKRKDYFIEKSSIRFSQQNMLGWFSRFKFFLKLFLSNAVLLFIVYLYYFSEFNLDTKIGRADYRFFSGSFLSFIYSVVGIPSFTYMISLLIIFLYSFFNRKTTSTE